MKTRLKELFSVFSYLVFPKSKYFSFLLRIVDMITSALDSNEMHVLILLSSQSLYSIITPVFTISHYR